MRGKLAAVMAVVTLVRALDAGEASAQTPTAPPPEPAPSAPPPSQIIIVMPPGSAPPSQQPAAKQEEEKKRPSRTTFGAGATYFSMGDVQRYGVLLQAQTHVPLADDFGLGVRFGWGLTEFRRFEDFTRAGYRTGGWTTQAYEDVYDWTRKNSGDPNTHGLRLMGSFFAFAVLWLGYVAAAVCYVAAPVAPTTYLELDLTADLDLSKGDVGPYLKAGGALAAFLHPRTDELRGGVGPTVGAGLRAGKLDVGATLTWLPRGAHGEVGDAKTHVFIVGAAIGSTF